MVNNMAVGGATRYFGHVPGENPYFSEANIHRTNSVRSAAERSANRLTLP